MRHRAQIVGLITCLTLAGILALAGGCGTEANGTLHDTIERRKAAAREKPYDVGVRHGKAGVEAAGNPYGSDSDRIQWLDGLLEGHKKAAEEEDRITLKEKADETRTPGVVRFPEGEAAELSVRDP